MKSDDQNLLRQTGITSAAQLIGEYRIFLGWDGGSQTVHIRILEWTEGDFEYELSHFVKPPGHLDPYRSSHTRADTPTAALRLGVKRIMTGYNQALADRHMPTANWFVKNKRYL